MAATYDQKLESLVQQHPQINRDSIRCFRTFSTKHRKHLPKQGSLSVSRDNILVLTWEDELGCEVEFHFWKNLIEYTARPELDYTCFLMQSMPLEHSWRLIDSFSLNRHD